MRNNKPEHVILFHNGILLLYDKILSIHFISASCLKSLACFCLETDNSLKQRQCFPVSFNSKYNYPLMLLREMERFYRKYFMFLLRFSL